MEQIATDVMLIIIIIIINKLINVNNVHYITVHHQLFKELHAIILLLLLNKVYYII